MNMHCYLVVDCPNPLCKQVIGVKRIEKDTAANWKTMKVPDGFLRTCWSCKESRQYRKADIRLHESPLYPQADWKDAF